MRIMIRLTETTSSACETDIFQCDAVYVRVSIRGLWIVDMHGIIIISHERMNNDFRF